MESRKPAVAGTFYPGNPSALSAMVDELLSAARPCAAIPPKVLVAPHAGYQYSGAVAASAYAQLRSVRDRIERVVLVGPSHRVYLQGLALPGSPAFATPLGEIAIDAALARDLLALDQVSTLDAAHEREHSLEVHLPFLQRALRRFSLVPLVVGEATPAAVAEVLDQAWGSTETLIVISTDLSHFLDYDTAVATDTATSRRIEALREDIRPEEACGCRAVNGLTHLAKRRGIALSTLDLRNSGDTAGPRGSVVGYGAYLSS